MGNNIDSRIVDIISTDDFDKGQQLPDGCVAIIAKISLREILIAGLRSLIKCELKHEITANDSHETHTDVSIDQSPQIRRRNNTRTFRNKKYTKPADWQHVECSTPNNVPDDGYVSHNLLLENTNIRTDRNTNCIKPVDQQHKECCTPNTVPDEGNVGHDILLKTTDTSINDKLEVNPPRIRPTSGNDCTKNKSVFDILFKTNVEKYAEATETTDINVENRQSSNKCEYRNFTPAYVKPLNTNRDSSDKAKRRIETISALRKLNRQQKSRLIYRDIQCHCDNGVLSLIHI